MSIEKLRKAAEDYIEALDVYKRTPPSMLVNSEFSRAQGRASRAHQEFVAALTPERVLALTKGAEALKRLRLSAQLLRQNSEKCAVEHHGSTLGRHGLPEWLVDAQKDISDSFEALTDIEAAFGESDD